MTALPCPACGYDVRPETENRPEDPPYTQARLAAAEKRIRDLMRRVRFLEQKADPNDVFVLPDPVVRS